MKKLYFVMALLIVASMVLTACGASAPTAEDCSKEEVFCVGLVTDVGKINDKSFNQPARCSHQHAHPWRSLCPPDRRIQADRLE